MQVIHARSILDGCLEAVGMPETAADLSILGCQSKNNSAPYTSAAFVYCIRKIPLGAWSRYY